MKWAKRGCWLAAWGVWVWLGYGLFRELPRDLGKPISQLGLQLVQTGRRAGQQFERVVGFLDGGDLIVTKLPSSLMTETRYRVWNGRNGAMLHQVGGPSSTDETTSVCLRHGVVVGVNFQSRNRDPNASLESLDLRTGAWKNLDLAPAIIF